MENKRFRISKDCSFSGVYVILNLNNCKCYIGSTRDIKRRLIEHEISLRNGKHNNLELQKDYDKNHKFIAYPISRVPLGKGNYNKDKNLRYYEDKAIKLFDAMNPEKGYNKKIGINGNTEEFSEIYYSKLAYDSFYNRKNGISCGMLRRKKINFEIKEFVNEMLERTI